MKEYFSPAKINLFLHILNKRADGYHNLQTWFQFVDLKDKLTFSFNNSDKINISSNINIATKKDNLIYKAIKAFENEYEIDSVGVDINLEKNIPMGAGLGGGSSNAATTLLAMRDFFRPDIGNKELMTLGKYLGADVPIFLFGRSAWAEGIGEQLFSKPYKEQYILLIKPDIHISTKEFFSNKHLNRNCDIISRSEILDRGVMQNVFEEVFFAKYPEFRKYLDNFDVDFYMSGTGSCFYALSEDRNMLEKVALKMDKALDKWLVKTLNYAY